MRKVVLTLETSSTSMTIMRPPQQGHGGRKSIDASAAERRALPAEQGAGAASLNTPSQRHT